MDIDAYEVTTEIVQRDAHQIAGLLRYVEWLASKGHEATVQQVWAFYEQHLRLGRFPTEVAEDLGLPIFPEW